MPKLKKKNKTKQKNLFSFKQKFYFLLIKMIFFF